MILKQWIKQYNERVKLIATGLSEDNFLEFLGIPEIDLQIYCLKKKNKFLYMYKKFLKAQFTSI